MVTFEESLLIFGSTTVGLVGFLVIYRHIEPNKRIKPETTELEASNAQAMTSTQDSSNKLAHSRTKVNPNPADEKSRVRSFPKAEIERSRRELRTLLLERQLVSSALTRLYEAEAAGEITKEERSIISSKYQSERKSLDNQIEKVDALVEIADLETLRDQLISLVSEKVNAIESRLERVSLIAEGYGTRAAAAGKLESKTTGDISRPVPDVSDSRTPQNQILISNSGSSTIPVQDSPNLKVSNENTSVNEANDNQLHRLEQPIRKKSQNVSPESVRAEELQREILEALDRLEKLDIEA